MAKNKGGRPKTHATSNPDNSKNPLPIFDFKRFAAAYFPEGASLALFLNEYGERQASAEMIRKWYERNSIPGEWLAVLLDALERDKGVAQTLGPYINVRTTFPKSKADIFG